MLVRAAGLAKRLFGGKREAAPCTAREAPRGI